MASSLKQERPFSSTFWKEFHQISQKCSELHLVGAWAHQRFVTSNPIALDAVLTTVRAQLATLEKTLEERLVAEIRLDSEEIP